MLDGDASSAYLLIQDVALRVAITLSLPTLTVQEREVVEAEVGISEERRRCTDEAVIKDVKASKGVSTFFLLEHAIACRSSPQSCAGRVGGYGP